MIKPINEDTYTNFEKKINSHNIHIPQINK